MNKRAQGLSFKTIVVAIICLVVLIVSITIFARETGKAAKGIENIRDSALSCEDDLIGFGDQECVEESPGCPDNWHQISAQCSKPTEICCKEG